MVHFEMYEVMVAHALANWSLASFPVFVLGASSHFHPPITQHMIQPFPAHGAGSVAGGNYNSV